MAARRAPGTPQLRTVVLRRLKNLAPDCDVEFIDSLSGISFRLKDREGAYRSKIVNLYTGSNAHALDRARLRLLLRRADFPGVCE